MSSSTLLRALRRRGWILVVSVAAVSALALLIASTRPGDYSAQTVLLVPSSFGGQTPGNSDQATTLAGTYADLIGRDAALAGALGARLGIPTTSVGRHLRVHQHADSALLTVSYVGDDRDDARRGAAALAATFRAGVPANSSIAQNAVLLVRPATAAQRLDGGRWSARVLLVVNSGAGPSSPANADGAARLARNYASVLRSDDALHDAIGHDLGLSRKAVADHLSVSNDENTSILRASFSAATAPKAIAGARAFARALTTDPPATPNVAAHSVRAVQRPTSATGGQGGTSHLLLVAIAVGLALGAALLVARERADQRIDGPEILADGIGCPATAADRLDPEAAGTLVLRWHAMRNGHPGPLRVALVPVDGARDPQVGTGLTSVLRDGARTAHLRAEGDDEDIAFVVGGVNGLSGERAAMESDLLVLVAQEGTPLAEAQAAAAGMAGLGRTPIWALTVPRRWPRNQG